MLHLKKGALALATLATATAVSASPAIEINFPEGAERVYQLNATQTSLSGADAAKFVIDNGFLAFAQAPDFETDAQHDYSVTAGNLDFNIHVKDVSTGAFQNLGMKNLNSGAYSWMPYGGQARTFPVQDREYVKLDVNGIPLADQTATNHRCVVDGANGLWWEVKDAPQSTDGKPATDRTAGESPQDVYDRFTYFENGIGIENASNNRDCHGYQAGNPATYCNSSAYATRINAIALCGKTDWRAPTGEDLGVKKSVYLPQLFDYASNNGAAAVNWDNATHVKYSELRTLLTPPSEASSKWNTYINEDFFPHTRPSHFLATSTYTGSMPDLACQSSAGLYNWTTFFTHGYGSRFLRKAEVSSPCKAESRHHLRLVRSVYTPIN